MLKSPAWDNYFYWLLGLSILVWLLEIGLPWRKKQARIRHDFWLDAFYMFFNLFVFPLLGFYALSEITHTILQSYLSQTTGRPDFVLFEIANWPVPAKLAVLFVVRDFIQWLAHILLHRVAWLWQFHKVHHSVLEMGFAAHLRYHWFENIYYRMLEFLPLAIIGFGTVDFFSVYLLSLAIGHWNHANLNIPLGPLKYLLNNPQMHIWHHARDLPATHPHGMNFGISLSLWDYISGTAYIPQSGRDIKLGFMGIESFPEKLSGQLIYPLQFRQLKEIPDS